MSSPNNQPVVEDIVSVFETTQNQSWSMFSNKLNNVSNKYSRKKDPAKSENTITLSSDDIPVFGLVPRLDKVMLVSCNECAMIVKRDCIYSHFYRRHNSSNVSHSEADKFSLVNFLCTVKTNKNKKLKMTVRKPTEKKMNEREKVNTVVKEIKTEFDEVEYERLLKTNRAKIKQEITTEYVDHHDVDMAKTGCNPCTSSGVFDWDVKPCIKSLALDQCTDHKINDKTIQHDKDSNKLSSVSHGYKEDLQSNKYLDVQNIEHTVNCITSSSELLKPDPIGKMQPNLSFNFATIAESSEDKFHGKYKKQKNKCKKCPYKLKNPKEETKLKIKKEYSEVINNTNHEDIYTYYNHLSNASAVNSQIEYYKLFSGFQNEHKQTKLSTCCEHSNVKSEMPIDSATSYYQSTESMKIKEEFQIIPNNMHPGGKIKEEYDENDDKCKVEFYQLPTELMKCSTDNSHSEFLSNTYSENVDSNLSSISPCNVFDIKEETTFSERSENIMNNESCSNDTVISNNQLSFALPNIKEESNSSLTTDYIPDNCLTKYYYSCTDLVTQMSPIYKNIDDELNFQIENDLNGVLNLKVEEDLNGELNFPSENHLNDELCLQSEDSLSDKLNLLIKEDLKNDLNLHDDKDLNDKINFQREECLIDEIDLPAEDDLSDSVNWQSADNILVDELTIQGKDLNVELNLQGEDLNVELNLQCEDNLKKKENPINGEDLIGKGNLSSDNIETNENLKYNCLIPSQIPKNEEETKRIPSKECSVIVSNESSNVAFTGKSPKETLGNEESKAKSKLVNAYVVIGNDGIVNNFENEHYQSYDHEVQISFTPSYKYSDVISNDSSDSSNESSSSYDQSSVESLDVSDKTDYSSTNNSSDNMSIESLYDSESTSSSSDQSTIIYDITKKPKYVQTNLLEKHEQFMGRITLLTKSCGWTDGKNNCTQTDVPLECMNCYDSSDDYVDLSNTQIDKNAAPINSNIQIDEYGINNFTPISSSAQIVNNKIIPMDVEEYELKDSNDGDLNISNKSHNSSHFYPHPCNPASQNNNLMHSPINENNFKIFNDELNAYKANDYITIDEAIPFINKNNEMYIELANIVDKKSVLDRKCKIMPFLKIVKNFKKSLKRQAADNKENRHHLITRGVKKSKSVFIDREFSCSDESNNNDNVDD